MDQIKFLRRRRTLARSFAIGSRSFLSPARHDTRDFGYGLAGRKNTTKERTNRANRRRRRAPSEPPRGSSRSPPPSAPSNFKLTERTRVFPSDLEVSQFREGISSGFNRVRKYFFGKVKVWDIERNIHLQQVQCLKLPFIL